MNCTETEASLGSYISVIDALSKLYRAAVAAQLRRMNHELVRMEDYASS